MPLRHTPHLLTAVLLSVACPGDDGTTTDATTTLTTGTPTGTTGAGDTGPVPTTSGDATTAPTSTSDETGADETTGALETTSAPSTSSTGEGTTGEPIDCTAIQPGPFEPTLFLSGYTGSEDLAFDGDGGLALKRDSAVVVVRADKSETMLAAELPYTYGTRYLADGRLLVVVNKGVKTISPEGEVADFVPGDALSAVYGAYADTDGAVWFAELVGDRILRVATDLSVTTIAENGFSTRGVVFDPQRGMAFYTNYSLGLVYRVAVDGRGNPGGPTEIGNLARAAGVALDACGNLYVVDPDNKNVYRFPLDANGTPLSDPVLLATFPSNVANAQFGVGDGFDDHTLYLVGSPGDVYTLALEFPGAPIATAN